MRKYFLFIASCFFTSLTVSGQSGEGPNSANSAPLPSMAAQAEKMMANPVNLHSGIPNISVPIYSYKSNSGISMSVSIDYAGGGIRVGEAPSLVGLGWYLNVGGSIVRTVRGAPDDLATTGYMYTGSIPSDWRTDGNKYYHDSLDSQQDIFQFNFQGHSGRFVFGKNGQIVIIPNSKIKILPAYYTPTSNNRTLKSFRIVAEDGVKYDFEQELTTYFSLSYPGVSTPSGYNGTTYGVSWLLTRIISPFSSDTIKFNYQGDVNSYSFPLPQTTFVNNATGSRKTPYFGSGGGAAAARKPSSIELPDKTVIDFSYSSVLKYNDDDYVLSKIKIRDTAFRYGYLFEYIDSAIWPGSGGSYSRQPIRVQLKSVTPFTAKEKQHGYSFEYNSAFPPLATAGNWVLNQRDHWGFFNGINNGDTSIPKINNYTWGANRNPTGSATTGVLTKLYLPTGGNIYYGYDLNTHYPYTKAQNSVSLNVQNTTQTTISLNQVLSTKHQLGFFLDKSVSRTGAGPVSGSGTLNLAIKSISGATTYLTGSFSLYELFYSGLKRWTFNLPNGSYMLETSLSAGTSTGGSFPVNVEWENKNLDTTTSYKFSGGLRVAVVSKMQTTTDFEGNWAGYDEYKYILEDGKSSGFLGETPRYDFPYREVFPTSSTTIDYTAICSEPQGTSGFAQIGYSRVEVVRNSLLGNLGKTVYEFTDMRDVNTNTFNQSFPYTPLDTRSWALGMPKRVSMYDSTGTLVKRTVNSYQIDTVDYNNSNFKSIKLGHTQTTYYGGPPNYAYPYTGKTKHFIADDYYLTGGRAYFTASVDTLFHANGSYQTSYQRLEYDTNFNITKFISSFDRNRGLEKEQRMYYPYNYTVGSGIGKLRDSSIISQVIASETWITGDANPRIIDAAATSFRQIANGDIKPDTIYVLESNKPILQSVIGAFNPAVLNRNGSYIKPKNYFVNYDSKGNLIEGKNLVTGQYASTFVDYDQQYTIAEVTNASLTDLAYTSFESAGTGNWNVGSNSRDITQSLSGKKSYNLSNGNLSKSGLNSSTSYLATFWLYTGATATVNGSSAGTAIATQNGWGLYTISLAGITSVTISGSGLIDEVRLHPKDANMQTNSFEPMVGVITTMNANNGVVYTEYDNLTRVKLLRDKDKNIIKRFDYSDTIMSINMTPLWVPIEKRCATFPGHVDSVYRDMNMFSDSYGEIMEVDQGYLDCSCPSISTNPQYKVVNGTCEMGYLAVTSSIYKKVPVNGDLVWRWVCTYRYCFSDGSQSTYYYETINTSSCSLTCFMEV